MSGIPRALDELIALLLEKSRHERLGRVSDVIAVLAALGAESPFGMASNRSPQIHLLIGRGCWDGDALLAEIDDRREQAARAVKDRSSFCAESQA